MSELSYQERVEKAAQQLFGDPVPGEVVDVFLGHDDCCKFPCGGECTCDPDIAIIANGRIFMVDKQGSASNITQLN